MRVADAFIQSDYCNKNRINIQAQWKLTKNAYY